MEIVVANEAHVEAVSEMLTDFFSFHAGLLPAYHRPARECGGYPHAAIESPEGDLFVAMVEDEAVGFVNVVEDLTPPYETFIPYRHATVVDLYVKPAHRGRGIATALLDRADTWAGERGLAYLELNVLAPNERGIQFYETSGFETVAHTMRRWVPSKNQEQPDE